MIKNTLLITLVIVLIYLYYQNRKLQQLPHSGNSSQTIFELDEEKEDLIAEKDEAIRKKNEAEQEVLSLSNRLRNKQSEVTRKETEIERLKKEKSSSEIALNRKISEKNGLITTLQREINQAKEKFTSLENELSATKQKYSKQGQLLDTEQLEAKKLEEKIEKLEQQITELTRSKSPLPGIFPEEKEGVYSELSQDKVELEKVHQDQLRKINLLFDDQAKDYQEIDFNGLYSLLQNIADEQKKKNQVEPVHQKYRKKK